MNETPKNELNAGMYALEVSYLQSLTLKNQSRSTIGQVERNLDVFRDYVGRHGLKVLSQVDRAFFEGYKAYLVNEYRTPKGRPLNVGTIQNRIFAVQCWFRFLVKRGLLMHDPIEYVKAPRRPVRLPGNILRPEEVTRLMLRPDLSRPDGYRDRAMMEFLYATGARASEVLGLRLADLNLERKTAFIRAGKGLKDRVVPLTTQCVRFLTRYVERFRPELEAGVRPAGRAWLDRVGTGGDRVFLSIYGGPVSLQSLEARVRGYLRATKIERKVRPIHVFRHSIATHLLEDGMDVRYVQVLLGHNNINSTQIYTHVERKTMHKMIKRYHPRCRVNERVIPFVEEKQHVVA